MTLCVAAPPCMYVWPTPWQHIDRYGIAKVMEMTLDHLAKTVGFACMRWWGTFPSAFSRWRVSWIFSFPGAWWPVGSGGDQRDHHPDGLLVI